MSSAHPPGRRRVPRPAWASRDAALGLAVVGWLAVKTAHALASVAPFAGVAIDGPFQLYDALRRITAGQVLGRDFEFFHGPGLAYLHLPLYAVFGGGLFASELSRELLPPVLALVAQVAVLRTLGAGVRGAVGGSLVCCLVSDVLLPGLTEPSVSLLSTRSALALLALVPLCRLLAASPAGLPHAARTGALGGAVTGTLLAFATDQGVSVGLALVAWLVGTLILRRDRARTAVLGAGLLLATGLTALLWTVVLARSVTGGLRALRYNLVDLPGDQFWYFGTPPNPYLRSFADLLSADRLLVLAGLLTLAALVVSRLHRRTGAASATRAGVLVLYAAASTSSYLGIAGTPYLAPAFRVVLLLALAGAGAAWRRAPIPRRVPTWAPALLPAAAGLVAVGCALLVAPGLQSGRPLGVLWTRWTDDAAGAGRLAQGGPRLDGVWQRDVAATRQRACRTWSLYGGLAQAEQHCFGPQSPDYVIHALGRTARADYLAHFLAAAPPFAETPLPAYTQYEPWLRNTTWPLYEQLLTGYTPRKYTFWSLLWTKVTDNGVREVAHGRLLPGAGGADLPGVPRGDRIVVTVRLAYAVTGRTAPTTRLLADPVDSRSALGIPLDPRARSASIPLYPSAAPGPVGFTAVADGVGNSAAWHPVSGTWTAWRVPDAPGWYAFLHGRDLP